MDLVYKEESYKIVGACFEVYNEMGCGFVEPVYQECLEMELELQQIPFDRKVELLLQYKGRPLRQRYIPDFICYGKIIVELKAVSAVLNEHRAQVHNYLTSTGYKLGLLINFCSFPNLFFERIVR